MTPKNQTLAARLIWAREKKGWKKADLRRAAGLKSASTLTEIENGMRTESPQLPVIAEALGVEVLWLQHGRGEIFRKELAKPADLLPSSDTNAITNVEQSAGNVSPFANRRSEDHPAIAAVVKLMLEMDDVGKGRLLERATVISEQHAKANPAKLSQ